MNDSVSMIVIVDDEVEITNLLFELVKHQFPNSMVVKLTDPNGLMNLLENNSLTLVILDIVMPNKNGIGLLKEIRKVSCVNVIMVSGMGKMLEKDFVGIPNVFVVEKPFCNERFEQVLGSLVAPRQYIKKNFI